MIGRLRRTVDRSLSGALLLRDAARASRRWQTYGMRAGFSALLLGVVVASVFVSSLLVGWMETSELGWLGRTLFMTYSTLQVLFACIVAPFGVARAVIEEREQKTLELLVLTKLEARQILVAKVFARLLVLMTVILGAMPALSLMTSLGGVSVAEVVAVTLHALLAVLVLGAVGGFFAIFTSSPIVATIAALAYGFCAFFLMPFVYWMLTFDYKGLAHFSPLFGTVTDDWWSLLPLLAYAPVVAMVFVLGARLFEYRVRHARLRHFFSADAWASGPVKWFSIALGVWMLFLLPPGAVGSWVFSIRALSQMGGTAPATPLSAPLVALNVLARADVWLWCVGLLLAGTWLFLRLAMDMVMMADEMILPRQKKAETKAKAEVSVWANPVAWHEMRTKSLKVIGPTISVWLLALLAVFQMGFWVIPGGLLAVGGINAAAALVLTVWLATGSVEVERRDGTLEVLLTSTLGASSILIGKIAGVALPTGLLLLVSLPLLLLGAPQLHLVFANGSEAGFLMATAKGLVAFAWIVGFWVFVLVASLAIALRIEKPRAAYGLTLTLLALYLLLPPLWAGLAADWTLLALPARLLVPVLVSHPSVVEMFVSIVGLSVLTLLSFALCSWKLREWGMRHA